MGVLKSRQLGLPQLWSPITLRPDLGSRCGLKQSCSSCQELFNGMSHVICRQVNRVDSRLFLVGSQTGSLIPDPSFGHNLCFRFSNEQWKLILDIYVPRAFQWYKERHKQLNFDPWNHSLKFRESTKTPYPKVGVALGVWRFTPSHFLTLPGPGVCDVTPGLSLGSHPCNPFALVMSPKPRLWHFKSRRRPTFFNPLERKNSNYSWTKGLHYTTWCSRMGWSSLSLPKRMEWAPWQTMAWL